MLGMVLFGALASSSVKNSALAGLSFGGGVVIKMTRIVLDFPIITPLLSKTTSEFEDGASLQPVYIKRWGAVWQSWIGNNIQGTCHVCNDQIYCTLHVLDMWELCHDVARAKGGPYSLHNMVPGSRRCNLAQRTLTITEYQRHIGSASPTDHVCHVSSGEFAARFPNATQELLEQFCKSDESN